MELICQDLGIPKKQIKATRNPDRFVVLTKKSWLKYLAQNGKLIEFPIHSGLDECLSFENNIGYSWCKVYFHVYKKYNCKVIPLPRYRSEQQENETTPLSFSQLLHYVSQSNHKNLWKSAYKQYSASRTPPTSSVTNNIESLKKNENSSVNLQPYESVLREVITRTYGCNIVNFQLDKLNDCELPGKTNNTNNGCFDSHVNLYPVISAIETNTNIIIIFDSFIENNLLDCVTYSPAILDKSHNKPLFLIYQLLHLMKTLHDKGLLLGDVSLNDLYITENLWLQIMPRLDSNVLQLEGLSEEEMDFLMPNLGNHAMSSPSSRAGLTNPTEFYSKYLLSQEIHLSYSLKEYSEMWCHGQLSNFDYLTILNNLSGRRIGCPEYHHIMPWITDFTSRNGMNWRDLTKSKYRLNKGDPQLDLMFYNGNDIPHHVSDVLSEITYYVYMARRTPKSVLCKHVRSTWVPAEYPASILRLQEWTPDECIPEFYSDPNVFKSMHEDLPDLEVPPWSSCPENFITKHREALESQFVSERLHHWIDLTFGYKLTGQAAIKAKNVCLSLVDEHKNLCQRGVVQLFTHPHPPKQYQSIWSGKFPPRINPQTDTKKRLTRSSEDLSIQHIENDIFLFETNSQQYASSPRSLSKLMNVSEDLSTNMERSPSYHMNVQKSTNIIVLPKDYNPIAQLNAVENMEIFMSKTFHHNNVIKTARKSSANSGNIGSSSGNIDLQIKSNLNYLNYEESDNSFTNRLFSESFEQKILSDLQHQQQQQQQQKTPIINRNFKQIVAEHRFRELQIIGCLIVEMFLSRKLRPLGSCIQQTFEQRLSSCINLLNYEFDLLPKCVQYPVKLLLQLDDNNTNATTTTSVITEKGLPNPSAHQLLQPLLNNSLFPFPFYYMKIYSLIKTLYQFGSASKLLDLFTYFDCDGKQCAKYELLDKTKISLHRKIAECKVKSCCIQIDGLLEPIGFEQFNPIELLIPHIIDLIRNDDTSILSAWYLFDKITISLGPKNTIKLLLDTILQLYDSDNDERINFLNSNYDSSMRFTTSTAFKCKKSYKLYHHSFLLKLIVRFGLRCFLENFISPLIEGVGGYKDPEINCKLHLHDNSSIEFRKSRSTKNFKYCNDETENNQIISPVNSEKSSEKTISPSSDNSLEKQLNKEEEMFDFEIDTTTASGKIMNDNNLDGSRQQDAELSILKIIDQFDLKSEGGGSSLDLRFNHSQGEELTEDTPIIDENFQINDFIYGESEQQQLKFYSDLGKLNSSFDDDRISFKSIESPQKSPGLNEGPKSPTIPIPTTFHHGKELSSIGCEIGSKKSIDSNDFLAQTPNEKIINNTSVLENNNKDNDINPSLQSSILSKSYDTTKLIRPSRISEMSAESLIWLSHRLGPVLSARYLTRNLLKMLTLCYVGQENLFPNSNEFYDVNYQMFSISDGRCVGDQNAIKVLECLTGISALFGEQFILLQYFPHVSELIALCKKRITSSLEGGLISSLQLLKYLVPCLSDSTIMDQLHDIILRSIIHPIIRLLGSSRCIMPSGFLARSVLARKLLDALYVLAIRIGPEMTREHLSFSLQKFFFIFNKAYGIADENKFLELKNDPSPTNSDDCNFVEIRREGGTREWCIKGVQISHARVKGEDSFESLTPPKNLLSSSVGSSDANSVKKKALEEIQDVFTPNLAHVSYVTFLKYLGESVMSQTVKNLSLILNLCHEYEQPDNLTNKNNETKNTVEEDEISLESQICSNSFGSNVLIVGNRIEVQSEPSIKSEMGPTELLNLVTYKLDQINTSRHLRGNWLAYWEHEIGRADKDNHFNLKQIKLQTFNGHTNSVRSILGLDNENSFMSASKDKTVKLWSLRSEGDGTKITPCQYTYAYHKKSVHSLAFLESSRMAISCDSGVHLWDPFVGAHINQLDSSRYSPVTIVKTFPAPSSLVICGTSDATIKIIDARTFSYINEWKVSLTPCGSVRCVAVSPSGSWIAVGLSSGQLILLDGKSGIIMASWKANDGELLQLVAPNESQLISSSLDHSISVWNTLDGSLLFQLKSPPEPAHCLLCNGNELITGTPANRIGVHSSISQEANYTITKLRSENFRGVLTSLAVLPLNKMILVGSDSGNISLLC